ncbi:MAG: DUF805 domain-containing protein, partial [Pseudomonadota bacterium]
MTDQTNPAGNPYEQPKSDLGVEPSVGDMPGLRRLPFFLASIFCAVLTAPLQLNEDAASVLWLVVGLLGAVGAITVVVLRLRNIGWSGWLALLYLVPVVNGIIGVALLALPTGYAHTK